MEKAANQIDLFGPDARFHHVGLVVKTIGDVLPDAATVVDPAQGVTAAFVDLHGMTLELLEPATDKSPVFQSLKKGVKLVHVCFEVSDLDAAIARGIEGSFMLIAPPVPAPAFDGRRIAWVYHPALGLFELLERSRG